MMTAETGTVTVGNSGSLVVMTMEPLIAPGRSFSLTRAHDHAGGGKMLVSKWGKRHGSPGHRGDRFRRSQSRTHAAGRWRRCARARSPHEHPEGPDGMSGGDRARRHPG